MNFPFDCATIANVFFYLAGNVSAQTKSDTLSLNLRAVLSLREPERNVHIQFTHCSKEQG